MLVWMHALYPKRHRLPSLLLAVTTLVGCQDRQAAPPRFEEPWPHQQEALFQEAESLNYSLQQHQLEQQRLRAIGVPENPPAPMR